MSTVLNDKFVKSEKEFGTKFCYTGPAPTDILQQSICWEDMTMDEQPCYLVTKAEELLERLEDGQGLNIVLPVALSTAASILPDGKKRGGAAAPVEKPGKKKKTGEPAPSADENEPSAVHTNAATVEAWKLPTGTRYLA